VHQACIYLHPWELDSEQPRITRNTSGRLRHYLGLRGAESKFRRLLHDLKFQPLGSLVEELKRDSSLSSDRLLPEIAFAELGRCLGVEENGQTRAPKGTALDFQVSRNSTRPCSSKASPPRLTHNCRASPSREDPCEQAKSALTLTSPPARKQQMNLRSRSVGLLT
jgi:hypothetical protein